MSLIRTALFPVIDIPREAVKRVHNVFRGVRDISALQAAQWIKEGAAVLDVRDPAEHASGHLKGSVLIPLGELKSRAGEIAGQKHQPLVVICHGGKRSATACAILAQAGFTRTANLAGGILAWRRAGLPEVRSN